MKATLEQFVWTRAVDALRDYNFDKDVWTAAPSEGAAVHTAKSHGKLLALVEVLATIRDTDPDHEWDLLVEYVALLEAANKAGAPGWKR